MKQLFLLSFAVLIIIASTAITHAHEHDSEPVTYTPFGTPLQRIEDARKQMEERRMQFREDTGTRREILPARADAVRERNAGAIIATTRERFLATIERLHGIADRIETRIEKMEDDRGTDLSDAREHLRAARAHLDIAHDMINDISTTTPVRLLGGAASSSNDTGRLRLLFANAKTEIKAAHEALREALLSLGYARGAGEGRTATSSRN